MVVVALATLLSCWPAAGAEVNFVIPAANQSVEGNSSQFQPLAWIPYVWPNPEPPNPNVGCRYQQVYSAAEFAPGGNDILIKGMGFRTEGGFSNGIAFASGMPMEVRLSTTAKAPDGLSTQFDDNFGSGTALVYQGMLNLSDNISGAPNPRPFNIRIVFQTPFRYRPADGNLLVEIKDLNGSSLYWQFDAQSTAGDTVSSVGAAEPPPYFNARWTATSGTASTRGLVTQFVTVPFVPTLQVRKAVFLESTDLAVGQRYQVQLSTDLQGWTNYGEPFTATAAVWRSTVYWPVDDQMSLFFRLANAP